MNTQNGVDLLSLKRNSIKINSSVCYYAGGNNTAAWIFVKKDYRIIKRK